ncbi:hypothetical protein V5O48_007787 [Marasmius crinis-equi]|uniref:Uncharacterized protein n=1 Tax=Marasmius crinis-equi TaxID=585013 RepID=A0ABR3FFX1_9AGAR
MKEAEADQNAEDNQQHREQLANEKEQRKTNKNMWQREQQTIPQAGDSGDTQNEKDCADHAESLLEAAQKRIRKLEQQKEQDDDNEYEDDSNGEVPVDTEPCPSDASQLKIEDIHNLCDMGEKDKDYEWKRIRTHMWKVANLHLDTKLDWKSQNTRILGKIMATVRLQPSSAS